MKTDHIFPRTAATALSLVLFAGRTWAHDADHDDAGGLILGQPPEYLHATGHSILIVGLGVSLLALLAG